MPSKQPTNMRLLTIKTMIFNREVEIPRIKHGKRQTLDTLISEEALLLAKYLRNDSEIGLRESQLSNLPSQKTLTGQTACLVKKPL